ncbi:MAG: HU family DNA-binding protein [Candidatus Omnitrophota bacterium]
MTKKEIVAKIAHETKIRQMEVKKVVQKTLDSILEGLMNGKTIELRNFGVFKVKQRRARRGRNPRTGVEVPVPPRKVVTFKPGLLMKKQVK